jgi:hypothetical protein
MSFKTGDEVVWIIGGGIVRRGRVINDNCDIEKRYKIAVNIENTGNNPYCFTEDGIFDLNNKAKDSFIRKLTKLEKAMK